MQKLNLSPAQKKAAKFARSNHSLPILNNSLVNDDHILINSLDYWIYLILDTQAETPYLVDNKTLKNGFLSDANLDINDYPDIDNMLDKRHLNITLPSIHVESYASKDFGRIALNSVILKDGNYFATDGHRAWLGNGIVSNNGEYIAIPREFIEMARKIWGKKTNDLKIWVQKLERISHFTAFGDDVTLHYTASNDDLYPYPSIQNVIPSEFKHKTKFSNRDIENIQQVYKDYKKAMPNNNQVIFDSSKMFFMEDKFIHLECEFAFKISFNLEYLTQIFSDLGNSDISIRYNTNVGTTILDNWNNVALLMPLRIV